MDFIRDVPSDSPRFRFTQYAEDLASRVLGLNQLPAVIGVFGGWGTGKTTFMRALERTLEDKGVKTVWLSAWKYNQLEEVWSALIVELAARIANETGSWDKAIAVVRQILGGGLKGVIRTVAPEVPFGETAVKIASGVATELQQSASDAFSNPFEDRFQDLVSDYIGYKDDHSARLVVFLDDIDRCLPHKAINVIESIKLYLDQGPLVFVIGADRQVIETAIQSMYGADIEYHGRKYLEKIIHIQVPIPQLSRKGVVDLFFPRTQEGDVLLDGTRRLLAAWSRGNPRRVIQFNNALATLEIFLSQLPEEPLVRLTIDLVIMLNLSHPQVTDRFLRLRDKTLWREFVQTYGGSDFNEETWNTTMPSLIYLHDSDPDLAPTMRAAGMIFRQIARDSSPEGDVSGAIEKAFGEATRMMTSVSGAA